MRTMAYVLFGLAVSELLVTKGKSRRNPLLLIVCGIAFLVLAEM